jgi:hypothetical protein
MATGRGTREWRVDRTPIIGDRHQALRLAMTHILAGAHVYAFMIIKAAPVDPARVSAAFEALATRIRKVRQGDGVAAGR